MDKINVEALSDITNDLLLRTRHGPANINVKYLHFICLAIDFVNSNQCCSREEEINMNDEMFLNGALSNSQHHIVHLTLSVSAAMMFSCYY